MLRKRLKTLFKLEMTWLKVIVSLQTKIHLFVQMIMPILLYGCEVWAIISLSKLKCSTETI